MPTRVGKLKPMQGMVCFLLLFSSSAFAALPIPKSMTQLDRQNAVEVLGFGSGYKNLGDPYPLGGYSGYELGLSLEFLNTKEIATLGAGAPEQATTNYLVISMSKGLFYGIDFSLQFSPLGQVEKFSGFGGAMRWGFAELSARPIHFSLQISANSASYQELINTTTQSLDLITGYTSEAWSLYGGVGLIRTSGIFIGGTQGITDNQQTAIETVSGLQYFGGLSVNFGDYFLAVQSNQITQNNTALKLGARF